MDLYKIVIVDDEEEIRLGIIKKIRWEEFGFEIIADAENGKEAIEKIEKLKPDIVITDIKMPYMDGLELCEKVNEILPTTKMIILSGFDDFEYAKKAIKLNVIEYILKPVNSIEFIEIIKKLKLQLDKEKDEKRNIEILKDYYVQSLPILRNQFLIGIIENTLNKEEIISKCKKLKLNFDSEKFIVANIRGSQSSDEKSIFLNEEQLIPISVQNIIEEKEEFNENTISLIYHKDVILIKKLNCDYESEYFIKTLDKLCSYYKYTVGISLSIGVGKIVNSIDLISASYKTAQNALSYRFILGLNKSIYIEDVERGKDVDIYLSDQEERELLECIKISNKEQIKETIERIFGNIEKLCLHFSRYKIYTIELIIKLLKLVQVYKINEKDVWGEKFNVYEQNEKFSTLEESREWIIQSAIKINKLISKERVKSSKLLIDKAKIYISDNYNDFDLSVEKVCSQLHVSQTYFSTIFKKETNMSFVNYLTMIRLEEAVKLLKTTEDKTYIVAKSVGYLEANYFSYVFKRKYGVSPSRYRKN